MRERRRGMGNGAVPEGLEALEAQRGPEEAAQAVENLVREQLAEGPAGQAAIQQGWSALVRSQLDALHLIQVRFPGPRLLRNSILVPFLRDVVLPRENKQDAGFDPCEIVRQWPSHALKPDLCTAGMKAMFHLFFYECSGEAEAVYKSSTLV